MGSKMVYGVEISRERYSGIAYEVVLVSADSEAGAIAQVLLKKSNCDAIVATELGNRGSDEFYLAVSEFQQAAARKMSTIGVTKQPQNLAEWLE